MGQIVQRLFSNFADGWPGRGLLLQRLLIGAALVHHGLAHLGATPEFVAPQIIAAGAGILLLAGLWTPVAGSLMALTEIWIALSVPSDSCIPIGLAVLGASLAMVGPGAWSIDARIFGRKHIHTPDI